MLKIFAGISFIQGSFFALVGALVLGNIESIAIRTGITAEHPFLQAFRYEETFLFLTIIGTVMVSSLAAIWLGLKFSHDAVGAIYRMKKDLKIMTTKKQLFKLKLRRNDYFKDFEMTFNDMVSAVAPHAQFEQHDDDDMDGLTPVPEVSWKNKNH